MIADQVLSRIEFMHSYNYIHRDIKPNNFLIGIGKKSNVLHLINFGQAKKYTEKYNSHTPYKENKKFVGNAKYVSINTHYGIEATRRDDLESVGYMLVYLFKGNLP